MHLLTVSCRHVFVRRLLIRMGWRYSQTRGRRMVRCYH